MTTKLTERDIQLCLFIQLSSYHRHKAVNIHTISNAIADLLSMSDNGRTTEFEIKRTVSDFRADKRKKRKHKAFEEKAYPLQYQLPNRFYYVMPEEVYNKVTHEIPEYAGVMVIQLDMVHYGQGSFNRLLNIKKAPLIHSETLKGYWTEKMASSMSWQWFNICSKGNKK